jgi:hypothetical protein
MTMRTRTALGNSSHNPPPVASPTRDASSAACAAPMLANVTNALAPLGRRRTERTGPKRVLSSVRSASSGTSAIPCATGCRRAAYTRGCRSGAP